MWRLGVQCEGSVRDPIRLAAPAPANLAIRPGCLGMEAGALNCPPADEPVHAVAVGRRTAGVNPLAPGSQREGGRFLRESGEPAALFWGRL